MSCDPIRFSQINEYMENYWIIHSFSVYGPRILERAHWRRSKMIGIKHFKLLYKENKGQFAKGNDHSENLAPKFHSKDLAMSLTLLTPLPPIKVCLWHISCALPAMNRPLPAELKFRENTVCSEKFRCWLHDYICQLKGDFYLNTRIPYQGWFFLHLANMAWSWQSEHAQLV